MARETKISWCNSTFNPFIGCTEIGPGCDNCYAREQDARKRWDGGKTHWGVGVPRYRTSAANWAQPLAWDRQAKKSGKVCRVFCASLADIFDNEVPAEWRADLMRLIVDTPHLTWLLVTKRIGNVERMIEEAGDLIDYGEGWQSMWGQGEWPDNVRLLISVCNQEEADRDIPKLLALPCKNGVSYEPALGPVDWTKWLGGEYNPCHEIKTERKVCLSSSPEWGSEDQARRNYLAHEETGMGSLARKDGQQTMQGSESRERLRAIPPSSSNDQRNENLRTGAPAGMVAFQGSNPGSTNSEPQRWEEKAESPGQFRTGDPFRTTDSRNPCPEDHARCKSEWEPQLHGQGELAASQGDSKAEEERRTPLEHSGGLQDQFPSRFQDRAARTMGRIGWIIQGGESGHKARPFNLTWARDTIAQCKAAGIPVFMKQLGARPETTDMFDLPTTWAPDMEEPIALPLKDRAGADPSEWPDDLRVQEFPE